ncbi:hypothetical protein BpHYR1_028016 [Brachionus plicatilis]|uniref:Uncharacterized protein n=1 Tax=Brachionus plicatilis TaxID=10195 RepID=A0A3M7R2U2_BRAPC|nr:hypothetical protein BpHYR1_028016 [Brachionus plicatilis]
MVIPVGLELDSVSWVIPVFQSSVHLFHAFFDVLYVIKRYEGDGIDPVVFCQESSISYRKYYYRFSKS